MTYAISTGIHNVHHIHIHVQLLKEASCPTCSLISASNTGTGDYDIMTK